MSARVLVVDDHPLNIKVLEAKLTSEYFDVIAAGDGASARWSACAKRTRTSFSST